MKSITIKCSCSGKCKNRLSVLDFGDSDVEINRVYLDKKEIKRLLKYLNKIISPKI